MSAGLTSTDRMFSVRETPWHNLPQSVTLDEYPTPEDARQMVHNWEPTPVELYYKWPTVGDDGTIVMEERAVKSTVLQLRDDTGDELGATTRTYTTVTNREMYEIAENLQNTPKGDVMLETGGSLHGGAKVWLMLRLQEPLMIKGDPHGAVMPYYLLQNDHVGGGSFRGSATQVRVVCQNTIRASDVDAHTHGTEFSFSHTKNVADRIEQARAALAGWRESVDAHRLFSEHMLSLPVDRRGEQEFVERFIPLPKALTSDRVKENVADARRQWEDVYRSVTCEGITGTAYGLLQAASEYSEWIRRAENQETRFRRSVLNRNRVITDATKIALAVAGA